MPNNCLCDSWCQELHTSERPDGWKCYHHDMLTEENLQAGRIELDRLTNALSTTITIIDEGSKLTRGEDPDIATPTASRNP